MDKHFHIFIHGLLLLNALQISTGHTKRASDTGYIECNPGELNVILAAPHGGGEKPDDILDRHHGCFINNQCVWSNNCGEEDSARCRAVTINDAFTLQLTEFIAENLFNLTGLRPTTVLNHLHRKKLDANRDVDEATFGDRTATLAWQEFQNCISTAKSAIENKGSGMGLFIDIHGHGHPNNWAELGYLVRGSTLNNQEKILPNSTSIYHLSTNVSTPFDDLLRGKNSFGHFLEEEGYQAVPSPSHYSPNGEKYFNGGYNTREHGSRNGGTIDAIQIESARVNREYPEQIAYGRAIAGAIVKFMKTNYPKMNTGYRIYSVYNSAEKVLASAGTIILTLGMLFWRKYVLY